MRMAYTQQEAQNYLGVTYETFRNLARRQQVTCEQQADDQRVKLYRAADIERLKWALGRGRQTDICSVLQADQLPQFGAHLATQLGHYLEQRVAVVQLPAAPPASGLPRLPRQPTRQRQGVDVYQLKAAGAAGAGRSWLAEGGRWRAWLTKLAQQYPKVLLLVATASPHLDLVLVTTETVCLVVQATTVGSLRAQLESLEERLRIVQELREGQGPRLAAVVLAGLGGSERDGAIRERLRAALPPELVVTVAARGVEDLLKHWYDRPLSSSRLPQESAAPNESAPIRSEPEAVAQAADELSSAANPARVLAEMPETAAPPPREAVEGDESLAGRWLGAEEGNDGTLLRPQAGNRESSAAGSAGAVGT